MFVRVQDNINQRHICLIQNEEEGIKEGFIDSPPTRAMKK